MKHLNFEQAPIFYVCANILGKRQYFMISYAANIVYIFSIYFWIFVCANIFGAIVLKPRFNIDVVVVAIWSIVIIINSVLTLQVSTASWPHDREPCQIKVVSNHTCSLHTCVCAGSRRVRTPKWLNQRQESVQLLGASSSAPFQSGSVCAEQLYYLHFSEILFAS